MKSNWKNFIALCLKSKDSDELARLLDCFLTPEEKNAISDRYAIINALLENKLTQRELSAKLHVSIAKITRGSNALKSIDPKLKLFLNRERQ